MAEAYGSHKTKTTRNHNNNLLAPQIPADDDDYVDYHDIWSKQPPKELMRQHAKVGFSFLIIRKKRIFSEYRRLSN